MASCLSLQSHYLEPGNLSFIYFIVSYFMLSIRFLVEGLGVFERNRVPLEFKILGLAFYIQLSSQEVEHYPGFIEFLKQLWRWVRRFSERVNVNPSGMAGRL